MKFTDFYSSDPTWITLPLTEEQKDALAGDESKYPAILIKFPDQDEFEEYQNQCQTKELVGAKGKNRRLAGQSQIDKTTRNSDLAVKIAQRHITDWRNFENESGVNMPFDKKKMESMVRGKLGYWLIGKVVDQVIVTEEEEEKQQTTEEE